MNPPIPPDTPCPHTLVLDMEDTLICSTWDRRYGWRHAKRPGADEFLKELSKYYEIVLFTSNIAGIGDPIMTLLDPQCQAMHRLHRDATRFMNGHHVKDLSRLNRNMSKIILIDDDPNAAMLQPENAIQVCVTLEPILVRVGSHRTVATDITQRSLAHGNATT
jgi:import inner membrane translocase subunit TIM50